MGLEIGDFGSLAKIGIASRKGSDVSLIRVTTVVEVVEGSRPM